MKGLFFTEHHWFWNWTDRIKEANVPSGYHKLNHEHYTFLYLSIGEKKVIWMSKMHHPELNSAKFTNTKMSLIRPTERVSLKLLSIHTISFYYQYCSEIWKCNFVLYLCAWWNVGLCCLLNWKTYGLQEPTYKPFRTNQLQGNLISQDGRVAMGNVSKRTGMNEHGCSLEK